MKTYYLTFVTILLFSSRIYSQAVLDGVYVKSDEELISYIDKMKQDIKANLGSYKKSDKSKDASESITTYSKDNELELISWHSENKAQHGGNIKEYYFHNKHLIYAEVTTTMNSPGNIINEEKMYFDNDHIQVWFVNGKKVDPASDKFKKAEKDLSDYVSQLKIEYVY